MNKVLPGQMRPLFVEFYRDAVLSWNPYYLKSNNSKRDERFLLHCSDRVILQDLPMYGKFLDSCLARGAESEFSFRVLLDGLSAPLPQRFLEPIVEGVQHHDPRAVKALRQILHLLAKLECVSQYGDDVYNDFIDRNASLPRDLSSLWELSCASTVWYYVCRSIDWTDIIPRHGPGVVATREKPWQKMHFRRIYSTVQDKYPADKYFFLNSTHLCDRLDDLQRMQEVEYPVTRLCCVPKDFRGPRLISAEPLETQWLQQGQARVLMSTIEAHPLTKGYVNFESQDVNRNLALSSSVSGDYTTIDLKDASDRVSVTLCREIMDRDSFEFLSATRSRATLLPTGQEVELRMMSPMGSAVCFPIESLVFYSLVLGAIHRRIHGMKGATLKSLLALRGSVYVYGDDIIVKSCYHDLAITALEAAGLKPNNLKCCTGPRFRESCGMDAYCGMDVTPLRLKHLPCRHDPTTLASLTDYVNNLNERGMEQSASMLLAWGEREFGSIPRSVYDLPLTVRTKTITEAALFNHEHFPSRRNPGLQCYEFKVPHLHYSFHKSELPCWCEVFRSVLLNTRAPEKGYPVPHRVRLTTRWSIL